MNLTENFAGCKILTINTKESRHRVNEFIDRRTDIPSYDFCIGLDGKKETIPNFLLSERWFTDLVHLHGTKSVCYSHFMIWITCMTSRMIHEDKTDDGVFFIIEDDVHVHPQFMEHLSKINIPDDFDFVHFSYWDPNCGIRNQKKVTPHVAKIVNQCCTGMFSYAIRPRELFKKIDSIIPFSEEIDNHIMRQTLAGKINTYVIEHNPWLTQERSEVSLRKNIDDESWSKANKSTVSDEA